ncbi:MAG: hypothetical protein GDA56_17060 [Hormoscilla sp. GM7CHS1pb]|nr:hypothetical protein [Hormoscilla sp. GM7CHS1pb]
MTRTYQPVAVCGESRKHGSEREDWEAIPSSTPTLGRQTGVDRHSGGSVSTVWGRIFPLSTMVAGGLPNMLPIIEKHYEPKTEIECEV